MRRRGLLALLAGTAATVGPRAALAQRVGKVYRLGVLAQSDRAMEAMCLLSSQSPLQNG